MAEQSFNQQLLGRLTELSRLVIEHQAWIFTILAYVKEQPAFDAARFGTIFAEQRQQLNLPKAEADRGQLDAALQALLRDFEGPIQ